MANAKTLSLEALSTEILKARDEATQFRAALDQTGVVLTPLTLLAATVAEYYDTCAANDDLPASAEEFATQVSAMAKVLALTEHKLMARAVANAAAETSNAADFTNLPAGAFVVPGPSEPQ
jgi:hypothetical protein